LQPVCPASSHNSGMAIHSTQLLPTPSWHTKADISAAEACPHCATQIGGGEEFCPNCGYQRGTWGAANAGSNGATGGSSSADTASAAVDLSKARYVLTANDGTVYPLANGETVAGRGDVALKIVDGFISRQHARFKVEGDSVTVTDLGSSNGTFVGEQRLEPNEETAVPLESGRRLGQLDLRLSLNPDYSEDATAVVPAMPEAAVEPATEGTPDEATSAVVDSSVDFAAATAVLSPWRLTNDQNTIELPLGELMVGRKADASDYVLSGDGFVSGRHCKFTATADGLSVTDLGSTNGTSVNGTRLEPNVETPLADGDALLLGQTELGVELGETESEVEEEVPETAA
jgi:pSer/pThr/pTyr-binding forkhead associated (FHA) protein